MKTIIVGLAIIFFAVNAQASTYREKRELNMEAKGIQVLDISCGAGALVIEGKEQQDIKVEAEIEIEGISDKKAKEFIKDKIELSLELKGTVAYLKSKINDSFWGPKDVRVNLIVTLPPHLNLKVDDGSGSTRLRHMDGDVSIKDGSGSIEVSDTKGNLTIVDGSGSIDVRNIQGDVTIKDGSGGISAEKIGGDLTLMDGSGSIEVSGVDGGVLVDDGSGSIDIHDVEKDVTIESDGSGSCNISGVKGGVFRRD
ncbi:MAG: hypothetical protein KAI84_05855 [Gammaproteobacteria bacterium]|nr:hypothetical protein [Gammaproteobacteria bacterium]